MRAFAEPPHDATVPPCRHVVTPSSQGGGGQRAAHLDGERLVRGARTSIAGGRGFRIGNFTSDQGHLWLRAAPLVRPTVLSYGGGQWRGIPGCPGYAWARYLRAPHDLFGHLFAVTNASDRRGEERGTRGESRHRNRLTRLRWRRILLLKEGLICLFRGRRCGA